MESKKCYDQVVSGSPIRKYDITNILFQYVVHERLGIDRGDENDCNTAISLYPSEYEKQIQLTTKKRLELLCVPPRPIYQRSQSFISVVSSFPLKVLPKEVIFQQFTPGKSYTTTVTISNTGKISHFVKLICEPNESFHVDLKGSLLNIRLAPGMSHIYNIQFVPREKQDYEHQINIVGDFGSLIIPLIGLGSRAILNFPDRIIMPDTPVNISSSKTILVKNIGDSVASFTTCSTSLYFSIEPSCGVMKEGTNQQFMINFIAPNAGSFSAIIYLKYEIGELLRIDVFGTTFNCNVKLEKEKLLMDDTFVGLSTCKSLKIYNDSDYIVKFMWMKYKDSKTDEEEKQKLAAIYNAMEEDKNMHRPDLNYVNLFDSQTYESICERVHTDDIASLAAENFLFHNSKFVLTPMIGEIWPRSFINVTVNFQPNEIGEISSEAHLEITGRETRIPMRFFGIGMGPILKLNTTTIDIGKVYLSSKHNLEIVCANQGLIPGTLIPKEKSSDFGGQIFISPQQLEIQPGEYSSFNLTFSSLKNGEFIETVELLNQDNSETLSLYIKGHVICPTLDIDQSQIDFGVSALGFTSKQEVTIRNVSSVPVTFSITISNDGNEPPVTYKTFINATNVSTPISFPSNPQEFFITPSKTTLTANSSLAVKIYFTPNIARTGRTCLMIIIQGSDVIPVILPILFDSKVASCIVKPSKLYIQYAFINFPYTLSFTVENTSDVEGIFYLLRESISIDSMTFYSMSRNQWHLQPGQSRSASITIITRTLGQQTIELKMRTFGKNTFDAFTAILNGHGPVISVIPECLDFGNVDILQEQSMALELINESPIPANFKVYIANKDSPWSIAIALGEMNPLKSMRIIVKLFLRDTGKHSDKILITVANGSTIFVTLLAHGSGSCIKIHPNIFPNFDMGQLLSHQDNIVSLNLTNEGNRWQKVIFSNSATTRNTRNVPRMPNMTTFEIEPHAIDLPPRSIKEINWLIHSDTCKSISEQWWVYCATEGQTGRELIGMSNLSATFIEPAVNFNKSELHFYMNMKSDEKNSIKKKLIDELEMINVSRMNLKVHLSIGYPFQIMTENKERVNNASINLGDNLMSRIRVCFSPNIKDSQLYSRSFVEFLRIKYDEHPNRDEIKCKGTVNYPNIIPIPRELQFDTCLTDSIKQTVLLNNNGSIPVNYQLSWIEESINVRCFKRILSPVASQSCIINSSESKSSGINEENDIESLKDVIVNEFPKKEISQMFNIVPMRGTVLPYSTEEISINFHSRETICLTAQLLCQIYHGPAEYIKVTARADNIKYSFDKCHIDFGHQPLFKICYDIINLSNICEIVLRYKIKIPLDNRLNSKGALSIVPLEGSTDPGKISQLELNYQSRTPGDYEESFNITIGNSKVTTITIKGTAVFPQVYLPLPYILSTRNYPIEDEYIAIKCLNIVEEKTTNEVNTLSTNENENDFQRLVNNGWEIVSINDKAIPEIIDIEMIIERYLAVKHVNENKTLIAIHISSKESVPIPLLFSKTYELNLGHAIIEQYTVRSTVIINYSSCKISMRMKNNMNENYLTKYGIAIKFRDRVNLMPGEFTTLDINIYPSKKNFSERSELIKRKIYLEVINGCTIPIKIIANVTSPWLTIKTDSLNFGHVAIGNCQLLRLFISNNGFINCQWKCEFSNTEKRTQMQFYLNNYQGNFVPGDSGTIGIYFKPQKSGYFKAELNIVVHEGLEPQKIFLVGHGIEKKLRIKELSIEFLPTTPHSVAEVQEFSIRNVVNCPVEFYWHHLDHVSVEEDRVIRTLLHYYQVNEFLLPWIKFGSIIPQRLYDFYYSLIDDMIADGNFNFDEYSEDIIESQIKRSENDLIKDGSSESIVKKKNNEKELFETSGTISNTFAVNSNTTSESSDVSGHKLFGSPISSRSKSSEEMEDLLHSYIDKLQENPEFHVSKNDPLKEIFDELNAEDKSVIDENVLYKRVCIIFHGAPFTQYQETACRAGRALDLSVINLDSAITEIIALGESSNSVQIRELIDDKYQELLEATTGLMNNFVHLDSLNGDVKKPINEIKIDEIELERFKKNLYFNLPEPDDATTQLKNFPNIKEINSMKPLCRYEYKIEGINLFQKIIDIASATTSVKTNMRKSITKATDKIFKSQEKKKSEKTFLNIELYIFQTIIQEIFDKKKYQRGFVLQTLDNNFIKTDVSTLSSILRVTDQIDFMTFVTFHNSLELYKQKFEEKQNEVILKQQENLTIRLKIMDEMSSSEFELLSEDEKCLFFEKVLRPRISAAQQRRAKFKGKYQTGNTNFTEKTNGMDERLKKNEQLSGSAEIRIRKQTKFESEKLQKLTQAFMNYKISLTLIEPIIKDYFHIWHVKSSNPWDPKIHDIVVNQLTENQLIKQTSVDNKTCEAAFKPQLYSIVSKNSQRYEYSSGNKSPFNLIEISSNSNIKSPNSSQIKKLIEEIPHSRVILKPKEVKTFRIAFRPTIVGSFVNKFLLSIAGVNNKTYRIDVTGNADIPHLQMDPVLIFNNVEQKKQDDSNNPTYYIDEKTFDFGCLLIASNKSDFKKVHRNTSRFNFFNSSIMNVDVEFSLANDNWETFNLLPRTLSIKPNEFGSIQVVAAAPKSGLNTDQLLLILKNNPHIEEIVLECSGCELNVELSARNLSFGQVLLFRREYKSVTLKNKSAVPIFWKILENVEEKSQIIFPQYSNWAQAFSDNNIEICYHGQRIGPMKQSIIVGIFSDEFDKNPLLLETLTITGKTYDVTVDVNDANPINFNTGKIGNIFKASFTIKNCGENDINFIIELENVEQIDQIDRNLSKNLEEDFHVVPSFGSLLPNKMTVIDVTFVPRVELNLKQAPLLKCNLLDTNIKPTIVAELPLTVKIQAEYNRFDVEPYPELFFGPVSINAHKQMSFHIKNIGIFPIRYKIVSTRVNDFRSSSIQSRQSKKKNEKNIPKDRMEPQKIGKIQKKEKSITKSSQVTLRFGPFILKQNQEGILNINQTENVIVDCYSETEDHFENEIFIFVDNCSMEDQNGRKLKLIVDFYKPKINFHDLDFAFQDSHVVNSIEDFNCPSEIKPFSIFTKDKMCLHFERVIVATTHTVKLNLSNKSLVPAEVSLCLRPDALLPKNSPSHTFTLNPTKQYISPLNSAVFAISFTPTFMETYTGLLEASIDLPSHIGEEKLSIKLSGEGLVAEIVLIQPEIFCKRGHAILEYGKCVVDETITKDICFKNVGKICAKITTEIFDDFESLYELKFMDDVIHKKVGDHCIEVNSNPGQLTQLSVLFTPKDEGKYEAHVRLLIAENPYENLMINLNGEGFVEPVIIIGLPLLEPENITNKNTDSKKYNRNKRNSDMKKNSIQQSGSSSESSSINSIASISSIALIYFLEMGSCFLNEGKEVVFKIVNKSPNKTFRFIWNCHDNFTIKPSIGHIYSFDKKNIIVSFVSSEPVSYDKIPLDCAISEIEIIGKREDVAWDDQHMRVDYVESSSPIDGVEDVGKFEEMPIKKIIHSIDEPAYEILNSARLIQLLVSASAAHATYTCTTDELHFEDTFIFETREQKFELKNSSIVNLNYSWKFNKLSVHQSNSTMNNSSQTPYELSLNDSNESYSTPASLERSIDPENKIIEGIINNKCELSFDIEPRCGTLFPSQSKMFTVYFSPSDAVHYRTELTSSIANLNPDMSPLIIIINGTGLQPYYHFDIRKSNYSFNKENALVTQDVKIVEFKVIGVGKNYIKHFDLINPTTEPYHFSWVDKTFQSSENVPYFHCKIQDGIAESGKRTKITFTFLARAVGVFEALWSFSIHKYNLEVPFLLVGIVSEPHVICCTPKITMAPTALGTRMQYPMIIRNNEEFPLRFRIIENSVYSEGELQSLLVEPMSGILSSQNDQKFNIIFKSTKVGHFSFMLQCKIERMKEPLKCFVTANVSKIQLRVIFLNSSNEKIELQTDRMNVIDLGRLMLRKLTTANFEIINMTEIAIKYEWNLNSNSSTIYRNNKYNYEIGMSKINGHIKNESTILSTLEVTPMKKLELKNHAITLKIINGPSYKVLINATAKRAPIEFSFSQYDFGACYVKENLESSSYNVELQITNNEDTFAILECNNVSLPFNADVEEVSFAIPERSTVSIPIKFHPLDAKKYHETLNIRINSDIEQKIKLKGEGINYKVGLVNPRDKFLDFGSVLIGKIVKRKLTVINSAKASVKLKIGLIKKSTDTLNFSNISVTLDDSLHFEPSEFQTFCPNKTQDIILKFSPTKRMSLFEEKIGGFCADSKIIPLSFIRGRCIAAEFKLSQTHLIFDSVLEGSSNNDKLILHNTGDIGARCKWNIKKLGPYFTLNPLTGYSSPGKDLTFNVCFHPIVESNEIKSEAVIEIENYKNIKILFIGSCSKLPDPKDTILFSIPVRAKETKILDISNNANVNEKIEIVVTGDYFQSENILFINPNSTALCAVTYTPLMMSDKTNPHKGTLVLRFTRKNFIEIYALRGISLPPEAIENISREIPAKIKYLETLPVYNWLNKPQYFICTIKLIGHNEEPPIYTFNGRDKIEILANGVRDYQAVLCCYKGSLLNFNIIFTNSMGEYQFYELQYKIIEPTTIETIELTTIAQGFTDYLLKIENPLENESITYSGNIQHPDIKIVGLPKILTPGSKESIAIHYSPTIASESETLLNITSTKLGVFPYKLKLRATTPQKIYLTLAQITTGLGSFQTFNIVIKNNCEKMDEFTIIIDNLSFRCEMNKLSIPARDEKAFEVIHEPYNIGIVQAKLNVSSTMNPEIVYDITGNGIIPKPKGPFTLKPDQPLTIPFKNVFLDAKTFKYIVDPTVSFATSSSSNIINSKQTANIMVRFQDLNGSEDESDAPAGNAVTGKLIVYCTDPELSSINWIYYLKGTLQ